jgi:AmmeMemoRadiSam system protein A
MNKTLIKKLFSYARNSIDFKLNNKEFSPTNVPDDLKVKHGVFVTLTTNNELRGCIGVIDPVPLFKGVINSSKNSAFFDPRFQPLNKEEFSKVIIEISILSVPKKTTLIDINEGDGVILSSHDLSALFLPQVWHELPDKNEFLRELSMKAGLSPNAYNEIKTKFQKFSVEAYKETTPNGEIKKET